MRWTSVRAADEAGASASDSPTPAPAPSASDTGAAADTGTTPPAPTDSSTATPDKTTGTEAPAPQAKPKTIDLVDTYWHYGKIARYDLAADAGEQILSSGASALDILGAFESVAAKRGDNIDVWMLRFRSVPISPDADKAAVTKIRDVSNKLNDQINAGYADRRDDPTYIRNTIYQMSTGTRAFDNNMPRLDKSGEVAAKIALDILRDTTQRQHHNTCRRVLRALGRKALNPLLAATEMKDYDTLVEVESALGDIGYDVAIPYLARLAVDSSVPESVHNAARNGLNHINPTSYLNQRPSDLFYVQSEKFYYGKSDIEPATEKISYIWYWTSDQGLTRKEVPTPIFNDLLAMRTAEYAMRLDPEMGQAVSLWLAANSKREIDLPPGTVDATHKGDPSANYYNVSAGPQYLNDALARATADRSAAVAYKLCESLQNITGQATLSSGVSTPLMKALFFPNRQVRYEAAFALAQSLPTAPFTGSDRVVPLLVEAINQSAKPGVLVVAAEHGDGVTTSDLRGALEGLGYPVVTANSPADGAAASVSLPTIDLIVITDDRNVNKMIELEQTNARLQGASVLVLTRSPASQFAVQAATDPLMNVAQMSSKATLATDLQAEIDAARQHSGTPVDDEKQAADYALRAATLLEKLAITRGHALDVSVAEGGLLTALNDRRPEIASAAGRVLGTLDSPTSQNGLAQKANDETTPAPVRVSLYESLADSAKHQGNHLESDQIAALEKVVSSGKDAKVRDAAAEARGALNLPADQARTLILKQSKV